ncbi:3'-5' exonuclease [Egbenema bharatensis]|uniref:3'-5' exonuclease n=1 Tax=Egbenema bharatensis TaxID=3463334 RepID=UPI003A837B7A
MLSTDLLTYYRQISQNQFTVVDVETTGHSPTENRVTELSVLHATLADGIQQQQTDLINPQTRIPFNIIRFTGITQKMADAAPIAAEVLPQYSDLLNTGILTAHNIEFDYPFIRAEYARLGIKFDRPEPEQLCTVQLSRLMLPDLPSRSLPNLVKHFQLKVGKSHRAEADTIACWLVAERLFTEILNESDEVLLAKFARQRMPLKYAAKLLGCPAQEAQTRLSAAGIPSRFVGKGSRGTWMYQRGDVERVFYEQQDGTQLSML